MADQKLTALDAIAAIAAADSLYIVDAGGPDSKKVALSDLLAALPSGIKMAEVAAAIADTAAYGQLWVKNDAPNTLWFTDDDGTDTQLGVGVGSNVLHNGGFDFGRYVAAPATPVAMTDDVYNLPDRWYSLVQGANPTISRSAGIGTSQYSCKLIAGGTTNRYGIAEIVEAHDSIPLRGQTVIAQCKVKPVNNAGSGTRDYRIAILEWTGTADTVTSEVVNDWTSGTYTTGNFFTSTTLTVVATANVTATHNVESTLSVSGAVSSSCNNLIVMIWAEDVPTHAVDYVLIGEAGVYVSSSVQTWSPTRSKQEELSACMRYLPGIRNETGTQSYISVCHAFATTTFLGSYNFSVQARVSPTGITVSNVIHFGSLDASAGSFIATTNITHQQSSMSAGAFLGTIGSASLVAGNATFMAFNNATGFMVWTGCEL